MAEERCFPGERFEESKGGAVKVSEIEGDKVREGTEGVRRYTRQRGRLSIGREARFGFG